MNFSRGSHRFHDLSEFFYLIFRKQNPTMKRKGVLVLVSAFTSALSPLAL